MSNPVLILTIFFAGILGGCSQNTDVNALLQNPDTKQEVFSTIAGDHQTMMDFMNTMMDNEHAMMMMKGNEKMRGMMMNQGNMMSMMKDNPDMMHNMMSGMMKDGNMMSDMMQMMQQQGIMSEECMQSCMKMMADKGMNMDTEGMKGEDGHESHNH